MSCHHWALTNTFADSCYIWSPVPPGPVRVRGSLLFCFLCFPGNRSGEADRGRGLRRVHLQVFREQRPRRVPCHHAGVRLPHPPASAQTCRLTSRTQAGLSAAAPDWDSRAPAPHQKGQGQELRAHVGAEIQQEAEPRRRRTRNHSAHELNLLVNSCQFFALHKGQHDEKENKCCPVEIPFFEIVCPSLNSPCYFSLWLHSHQGRSSLWQNTSSYIFLFWIELIDKNGRGNKGPVCKVIITIKEN